MNITRITAATVLGAVLAMSAVPASAESALRVGQLPRAVYFEVYVHACEPVEYDFAGRKLELSEAGALVYDELFVGRHANSCGDFYWDEVASRTVVTERGLPFITVAGQ